ncbi:MAG: dihydrodipicolinate synthase family protein, partial [Eggerthellaceae bacterium]|nr:dihydrodipicolinate synthase family protein [Eggerthellaceae bacterium]
SNVAPRQTVEICDRYFAGDLAGAVELQCKYMPLISALFCEVNPIPVKAAMAAAGWCKNVLRSPLYPMEAAHEAKMLGIMKELGLI